jgi:PAS domain-containing protein
MRNETMRTASPDTRSTEADALAQVRAEADAAIAQAEQAHARLRDAIEILPHGLVFLDAEVCYIFWNK